MKKKKSFFLCHNRNSHIIIKKEKEKELKEKMNYNDDESKEDYGNPSIDRQRALEAQRMKALQKQQSRRLSGSTVQANTAMAAKTQSRPMSSFRNFSAPKSIDPLEDDEDDSLHFEGNGYAKNFQGSRASRTNELYRDLGVEEKSSHDDFEDSANLRVANMAPVSKARTDESPRMEESKIADHLPPKPKKSSSRREKEATKLENDLLERGIASSFDPDEVTPRKTKKKSSYRGTDDEETPRKSKNDDDEVTPRKTKKKSSTKGTDDETTPRKSKNDDDEVTPRKSKKKASAARDTDDEVTPRKAKDEETTPRKSKKNSTRDVDEEEVTPRKSKPTKKEEPASGQDSARKTSKKEKKPVVVESDESEDDTPAPVKKAAPKKPVSVDSDEDDEPYAPAPTRAMNAKKPSSNAREEASAKTRESKVAEPPAASFRFSDNIPSPGSRDEDTMHSVVGMETKVAEEPAIVDGGSLLDLSDRRTLVYKTVPQKFGTIQCYIERNKGGSNKLYPEYHLYLKEKDTFLMASKKRARNRTSNYMVCLDERDLKKDSDNFVGKLRANFLGTEFQFFDDGVNPKKSSRGSARRELGAITYASNVLGSRGPRKMKAGVPAVDEAGNLLNKQSTSGNEGVLSRMKDKSGSGIIELVNKAPRWNDAVGAYVLNFNGRVTMASVKNFQLVTPDDEENVILQFGRVGKDLFTMDFAWPLSPLSAFMICLSSFDGKLACE